jgi:hypothetical protein
VRTIGGGAVYRLDPLARPRGRPAGSIRNHTEAAATGECPALPGWIRFSRAESLPTSFDEIVAEKSPLLITARRVRMASAPSRSPLKKPRCVDSGFAGLVFEDLG